MRRKPSHTRAQRACRAVPIVHAPRPAADGLSPPNDEPRRLAGDAGFRAQGTTNKDNCSEQHGSAQRPPHCAACGVPVYSPNSAPGDSSVCIDCSPHVMDDPRTLGLLWDCRDRGLTLRQASIAAGFRPPENTINPDCAQRCIGCGVPAVPGAVVAGLQSPWTGEIAWACLRCAQRAADSDLFYQQLLACIGSGRTLPEVRDAFASYGFDLPTTDAERGRVTARVLGDAAS